MTEVNFSLNFKVEISGNETEAIWDIKTKIRDLLLNQTTVGKRRTGDTEFIYDVKDVD